MIGRCRRQRYPISPAKLTGSLDDLPQAISRRIRDSIVLQEDEIPAIASVFSDHDWLFMTTSRIVLRTERGLDTIRNDEVVHVAPDFDACSRDGEYDKSQFSHLLIKTKSGQQYTVHVEQGAGLLGILSVVFMFVERNFRNSNTDNAK